MLEFVDAGVRPCASVQFNLLAVCCPGILQAAGRLVVSCRGAAVKLCPPARLPHTGTSSGHSGQAQPAASALDSSHLIAESPAMVEAASMAVHPFMSPHPSMPVSPAQVAGGAPTLAHLAGVMMQVGRDRGEGCNYACRLTPPACTSCVLQCGTALHTVGLAPLPTALLLCCCASPKVASCLTAASALPLPFCRATPALRWTLRHACSTTPPSTTSPSRA